MEFYKVHAVVREERLPEVEGQLLEIGVSIFSFCHVRGRGEYVNYFERDPHVTHARLEIFVGAEKVDQVVQTILDAAATHLPGDGIVAVLPVAHLYRIRDRAEMDVQASRPG